MTFPVGGCEYGVVCRMHSGTEPRHRAKVLRRRELEETEKWLVRLLRQHRGKGNR